MAKDTSMVRVDDNLVAKARERFPETKGLTLTALVDFCLRKLLEET